MVLYISPRRWGKQQHKKDICTPGKVAHSELSVCTPSQAPDVASPYLSSSRQSRGLLSWEIIQRMTTIGFVGGFGEASRAVLWP